MAAHGYPLNPRKGDLVMGLPSLDSLKQANAMVFHAGTVTPPPGQGGKREVLSAGGRVLCVTALGHTVKEAQKHAYEIADGIAFAGAQFRTDIGFRAIKS